MVKSQPLQARLANVNDAIKENKKHKKRAKKASQKKHLQRTIEKLQRVRKRLAGDRDKFAGATAIIKYEVIPILELHGIPVTSRKRRETFGNPSSDHYIGNTDADAVDGGTFANNNKLGSAIATALLNKKTSVTGFSEFTITRSHTGDEESYRIQIITEEHGTGPHIHIGCKKVS
jgi:hypothetical protein